MGDRVDPDMDADIGFEDFCDFQTMGSEGFYDCGSQGIFGNAEPPIGFEDHVVDETAAVSENVQKKPKLDFVDAAASSMGTDTRDFNPVSSGMPSDLVRDAIRLDSKQALFPWEKGRLKAIFGERPLVESLVPKVKTSSNNFVQVNVAVGEGPSLRTARAIEVEHKTSDKALYMSAVKSFRGGSYIEERDIRRSSAVKLLKAIQIHVILDAGCWLRHHRAWRTATAWRSLVLVLCSKAQTSF